MKVEFVNLSLDALSSIKNFASSEVGISSLFNLKCKIMRLKTSKLHYQIVKKKQFDYTKCWFVK